MTLTLLSFYTPAYGPVAAMTLPNRDAYCARHGYDHMMRDTPWWGGVDAYYAFQRLAFIRDLLFRPELVGTNPAPDYVWALNVPSVITNLGKPVTDLLTDQTKSFWCAPDRNVAINMGSFIVKGTPWARRWLDHLISLEPKYRHDCWYENRAVLDEWEKPEWREGICRLDQRELNAYPYKDLWPRHGWGTDAGEWHPGDLVLSFPGTSYDQRVGLVREALANRVTP